MLDHPELFHVKHPRASNSPRAPTASRDEALKLMTASPATARRLDAYFDLLARWRKITNLISETTFADVWIRHFADCAQLLALAPHATRWLDLGSGAGFPGIVIAIHLAEIPGAEVHCVESDQRKCAFLRAVAAATDAPARVHSARIEAIKVADLPHIDAVTARALAPLPQLLVWAEPWLNRGAVGIFPRGRTADAQVEQLHAIPQFQIETLPSKVDPDARIARIRALSQSLP